MQRCPICKEPVSFTSLFPAEDGQEYRVILDLSPDGRGYRPHKCKVIPEYMRNTHDLGGWRHGTGNKR